MELVRVATVGSVGDGSTTKFPKIQRRENQAINQATEQAARVRWQRPRGSRQAAAIAIVARSVGGSSH